jgi:hypothetical protein
MDDVVLSVVKNRFWKDLDIYALSLVQSGFKGRKVMFVEDVPLDAIENLTALGFEVIPFVTADEWKHLHFQSYRYYVACNYLIDHQSEFSSVLWTDVCDLVFQSDPMEHVHGNEIVAAKEGRLINAGGGKGWNEIWIRTFLPEDVCEKLLKEEVLCSGSIAGDSKNMMHLLSAIWLFCKKFGELRGIDQGIYNYLMRTDQHKKSLRIPEMEDGFVSTCGMFMSEYNNDEWTVPPPYLDRENGLVLNELGKPFSIAHCYDRTGGFLNPIGDFRAILERRYRK